jgi:glycine/D-amino acid oxidase-like deaminating enzyme
MTEPSSQTWYTATMVAPPERPALTHDLDVDVCVVGAGLAGLTVAREVARRGWSVAVLEADKVAGGASGRNGGFVSPGFAERIDAIVERVGLPRAREL